ncbi:hypothetical protein [Bradyrhizobium sp. ORS 86]|uniref:hypothetical protein n=1 Tax=Bradyrhizobium sp. ORS 86 TaxID=1685970 RepID=UPI00388E50F2
MSTDDPTVMSGEQRKAAGRARGVRRMREIAAEDQAKREKLTAELLADLGRVPSALDRVNVASLAAAHVRAERLRTRGRSDLEERRQITQLMRATGLRPQPVTAPQVDPVKELDDYFSGAES